MGMAGFCLSIQGLSVAFIRCTPHENDEVLCYDTALYGVESPVTTWVQALGTF